MLSEEQKKRLEQAGWKYNPRYGSPYTSKWYKDADGKYYCEYSPYFGSIYGDFALAVECAAILGIHPKGYRLVKEETLQACHTAVKALGEDASWADSIALAGVEAALASSLSPKEEDKPHE